VTQNKDFRTLWQTEKAQKFRGAMQKPKSVSELIGGTSKALRDLRAALDARSELLIRVRSCLPARLIDHVLSAGLQDGCLTVGTRSAAWASRLRYVKNELQAQLNRDHHLQVSAVKIRVVNPGSAPPGSAS
jgi:hypothetical protein